MVVVFVVVVVVAAAAAAAAAIVLIVEKPGLLRRPRSFRRRSPRLPSLASQFLVEGPILDLHEERCKTRVKIIKGDFIERRLGPHDQWDPQFVVSKLAPVLALEDREDREAMLQGRVG